MEKAASLAWHEESVVTVLRREPQHNEELDMVCAVCGSTMVTFPVPMACNASVAWVVGAVHCVMATMPAVFEDTFGLSLDLTSLIIECCSCSGTSPFHQW